MRPEQLFCLCALLGIACATDVADRRIPNVVVALIAANGLLAQLLEGGLRGVVGALLSCVAIVTVFAVPWIFGKVGAGDVKLLASVAVWVGPPRLVHLVLYTAIAGLPVALGTRFFHRVALWRLAGETTSSSAVVVERETVPIALSIAMGTAAVLTWG